jgi:hypothetical protein
MPRHLEPDDERAAIIEEQYTESPAGRGLAHEIKNPQHHRLNLGLVAEDFAEAKTIREQRALQSGRSNECIRLNDILKISYGRAGQGLETGRLRSQ